VGYDKGATYSQNYEDPMDLDTMNTRPLKLRGRFNSRGRGGNTERDKHRREGLYYKCGKSRYWAREYNSKP
jgi:hypothetical protein